jgi:tRNA nucleotidyltransferase/poly(A) polymerase
VDLRNVLKNLPPFLQVTEEQIAISRQIQERAKQAMYGRVKANQEEARLIRGITTERFVRAQLEILAVHPARKGKAELIRRHQARLADAYADQGRYAEAAKTHPVKKRAREYAAIQKAIDRPDDESCGCPELKEVKDPATGATLQIPQQNKIEDVFSPKHGRMMPLVRCSCGDLNAKALPLVLARREALNATAHTLPVRDADVMK